MFSSHIILSFILVIPMHQRSDINVLLCGDPGTSKSQLLAYVHKMTPRGIYTSGKGSSAVGLTASVVRDPETKDMVLESGSTSVVNLLEIHPSSLVHDVS